MTIETKFAKNGSLIVKVNGKRTSFYEAVAIIDKETNMAIEILTDRSVTYTLTCRDYRNVFFRDSLGNLYKFDRYATTEALRDIANGTLQSNLYRTVAEIEIAMKHEVILPAHAWAEIYRENPTDDRLAAEA